MTKDCGRSVNPLHAITRSPNLTNSQVSSTAVVYAVDELETFPQASVVSLNRSCLSPQNEKTFPESSLKAPAPCGIKVKASETDAKDDKGP